MSKKFSLLKLCISIVSILVLLSFIRPADALSSLSKFNFFYLPLLIFFILINIALFVVNYWIFLERKVPLFGSMKDYFVVWSFSLFLPGKMGELGIIPVLKKKYGVPYKFAIISTVIPKAAIFFTLVAVFLLLLLGSAGGELSAWAFGLLGGIIILALILRKLLFRLLGALLKFFAPKNKVFLDIFENRREIKKLFSARNILVVVIIAVLRFFSLLGMSYFSFLAFGFVPQIGAVASAIALSQVAAFIPISMNGLGVREATYTGILAAAGVPLEISLSTVVVSLMITYGMGILIMALWNVPRLSKFAAKDGVGKKI